MKKDSNVHQVSFKESDLEQDLKQKINDASKIIGVSNFYKQLAYDYFNQTVNTTDFNPFDEL